MTSPDEYQPPPLEDILKTLSRFSSTSVHGPIPISKTPGTAETKLDLPPTPAESKASYRSQSIDPSTITSWPQALKYVVSNLSQSSTAGSRIKTLIHSQRRHEKQWWAGREDLIAKQRGRDERKKKADDLLRALGSGPETIPETSIEQSANAEAARKELEVYDRKVYQALSEMSRAMDGELRGLGVPFFAIKHNLVDLDATVEKDVGQGAQAANTATLRRDDLVGLQKQMLELLEALFGD